MAGDLRNARIFGNSEVNFAQKIRSTESTALHPVGQTMLNRDRKKQYHLRWIVKDVTKSGRKSELVDFCRKLHLDEK